MSSKKSLLILVSLIILFLFSILSFNLAVDPYCFMCKEIDVNQKTLNRRYQIAQIILRNPDAEQIILGSSRGESTSPNWLSKVSGLKTLNLSYPAAGIVTKTALLELAIQHASVKKVIWYADYFELMDTIADGDIFRTKSLSPYAQDIFQKSGYLQQQTALLKTLLDRNTIEASFRSLNSKPQSTSDLGAGSDLNYTECADASYSPKESRIGLNREIDVFFDRYTHGIINKPVATEAKNAFENMLNRLKQRNIEIEIIVIPYHPQFMKHLKDQYPDIYSGHLSWIDWLESLRGTGVYVKNYFQGIPNDDQSSKFWVDGVHFTCRSVLEMLGHDYE